MKIEFRTLKANEIDCRIGRMNEDGLMLLLYKDARVDMDLLDETVGPMNWKREHTRDNANCIVSIWDDEKKEWVSKEDTGTESNTEKEKGLASDSMKRACVNWGIGRELYTAPFIWVEKGNYKTDKSGKCYNKFTVEEIGYDDDRNINKLVIKNTSLKKVVFSMGSKVKAEQPKAEPKTELKTETKAKPNNAPTEEQLKALFENLKRIEDSNFKNQLKEMYDFEKVSEIKDIEKFTEIEILVFNKLKNL